MVRFLFLRTLVSSLLLGIVYGCITFYNPFVFADAIILLCVFAMLIFLSNWLNIKSGIKSKAGLFFRMIISGLVVYLTSWAATFQLDTAYSVFSAPDRFFPYIIAYTTENPVSISRISTTVSFSPSVAAALYTCELIVLLLPSLNVFRRMDSRDLK